jgi:hypothetical protein
MAVGWQLPNGTLERPIPANRLSPFESQTMAMTAFGGEATMMQTGTSDMQEENVMMAETSESDEALLEVFPNPASSGVDGLTISGHGGAHESFDATVEIQHITGEVVYSRQFSCEGNCGEYVLPVDPQLTPGVYLVHLISNGKRSSKRLLVK